MQPATHKPFKIPTLLGLLLVVLIIAGLAFATQVFLKTPTEAEAGKAPQQIKVTNVTDAGFTVTWYTEKPTRGIIQLWETDGKEKTSRPVFDERHTPGNIQSYTMHSVPVRGLKPTTSYSFQITEYEGKENKDQPHVVVTTPTLPLSSNSLNPAYGMITTADGKPASGALIYLSLAGSQILSTIVKPSGSFLLPINLLRTENGDAYYTLPSDRTEMHISVILDGVKSEIITDTKNHSPVPNITLGTDEDFRNKDLTKKKKEEQPIAENKSTFSTVLGSSIASPSSTVVTLLTPVQGAKLVSSFPLISGLGIPKELVTISVGMKNQEVATTRVSADGTWNYTPKKALGAGNQSVTITSFDKNKKPLAITHLFEIMKSGTQVLGDATPSGTIAVTPTIAPTSAIASPTPTLPIPTATIIPTPTTEIPVTATTGPSILLLIAGAIFVLAGLSVVLIK